MDNQSGGRFDLGLAHAASSEFSVIAFDADDTLWHTESAYAATYDRLVDMLLPYMAHEGEPRAHAMERLEATERANLATFGYGAKAFVLSMIETAIEVSHAEVAVAEIAELIAWGKELVTRPVALLDGVAEALAAAARSTHAELWLLTKGDLWEQEDKIARSGVADLFAYVEIMRSKTPAAYAELLAKRQISPERFVMLGNSLASDVRPVLECGGYAIHVPYRLTWALEVAPEPVGHPRYAARSTLLEAVELAGHGPAALADGRK